MRQIGYDCHLILSDILVHVAQVELPALWGAVLVVQFVLVMFTDALPHWNSRFDCALFIILGADLCRVFSWWGSIAGVFLRVGGFEL